MSRTGAIRSRIAHIGRISSVAGVQAPAFVERGGRHLRMNECGLCRRGSGSGLR